jgi:oligoribonuclease
MSFLNKNHVQKGKAVLGGNSVHMDRLFLLQEMPMLTAFLSYRIIDVSTIKELGFRWFPDLRYTKSLNSHRARDDILESIEELKFYRNQFFKT